MENKQNPGKTCGSFVLEQVKEYHEETKKQTEGKDENRAENQGKGEI